MSGPQQPLTRRDMFAMSRPDALTLGIPGCDAAANRARLAAAARIHEEQVQYDAAVYAEAAAQRTTVDPDPIRPFGLDALLQARGDVQAVVDDPDFARSVLKDMGRGWREEIVSDEDGTRWGTIIPTPAEEAEAAYQAVLIHDELANRGIVASRPTAPNPIQDALVQHFETQTTRHPDHPAAWWSIDMYGHITDPILHRIEVRELLNHLLSQHRGDQLAHALQTNGFVPTSEAVGTIRDRFDTPVPVPHSSPRQELRHAIEAADELVKELIDTTVANVARYILAAELVADPPGSVDSRYGSVWTISFGSRESDGAPDQADIDGELDSTWHFSSHELTRITDSGLRLDMPADQVAAWITDQARHAASPRQTHWDARIRAIDPFARGSGPGQKPSPQNRPKQESVGYEPPATASPDSRRHGTGIL
ncbi:hypothetical protein [Myceligenerans crystallogenes]|uniref:DUF222 domain-containing protein n=1 Tax=Myceligenerans crystallogenes TaxID=316335 RepID=A0ABN2N638_9MICO